MKSPAPQILAFTGKLIALHAVFFAACGVPVFAQTSPTSPQSPEATLALDPFVVSTAAQKGYITSASTTASRVNTPLVDIPSTINIINRELLDDTGAFEFRDAAQFVSGVTHGFEHSNLLNVRGAAVRNPLLNGFGYATQLPLDPAYLDRLEIIKGPNAILAPTGLAGGDVNAVIKEPMGRKQWLLRPIFGNYVRRFEYDFTGPAGDSETFLYRVSGALENSEGYRDNFDTERRSISPAFTWNLTGSTSLTVVSVLDRSERQIDSGLPIVNGRIPDQIDRQLNTNDESFTAEEDFRLIQVFLRTHLSDSWKMQLSGSANENDISAWEVQNSTFDVTTGDVSRSGFYRTFDTGSYGGKLDFVGTHALGVMENRLQFGGSIGHGVNNEDRATGTFGTPVNVYTGARPDSSTYTLNALLPAIRSSSRTEQVYVLDQMTWFDGRLIATIGGTATHLEDQTKPLPGAPVQTTTVKNESETTYQYGLVYKILPKVSLYYGFNQNFRGQNGRREDGSSIGSSFGELKEFGAKAYIVKDQIFATASVFEVAQTNQFINDPFGGAFQIPIGDLTVKGFEFDINAYFDNGLSFIVTYSNIEAPLSTGLRARTVPEQAASIWTKYRFQHTALRDWSVGLSMTYRGEQYADVGNTPNGLMPSVTLFNGFIGWERKNISVRVNLQNLTDKDHIRTGVNLTRHQPGDPLSARASLTYKF